MANNDIAPTDYNAKRYTALLFTSVAAITMAGLIAFLSSTKPQLYTGIQGQDKSPLVQEVSTLINSCRFVYKGCGEEEYLQIDTSLQQVGQAYNVNPQMLVTLATLKNPTHIDTKVVETIAQELTKLRLQIPSTPVKVYNHPQYGSFKIINTNTETLILMNYFATNMHTKEAFMHAIARPIQDDQIIGFIETFEYLYGISPTAE